MTTVDIINQAYAAFAAGDIPAVVATFAEDIEWTEPAGISYAGTYVGAQAIVENVFMRLGADWDGFQLAPDVLLEDGDRVAVLGWYTGTFKKTGRPFRARFTHWWKLSAGKVSGFELVVDSVKMQEAMSAS